MSNQNQHQGHGQQAQQPNPAQAAPMGQIVQQANPAQAAAPANAPQPQAQPVAPVAVAPQANAVGNPIAEPPLSAEALAWLPFVNALIATAPRVEAELPQNRQHRQPIYVGRP